MSGQHLTEIAVREVISAVVISDMRQQVLVVETLTTHVTIQRYIQVLLGGFFILYSLCLGELGPDSRGESNSSPEHRRLFDVFLAVSAYFLGNLLTSGDL